MAKAAGAARAEFEVEAAAPARQQQLSKYLLPGLTALALVSGLLLKGAPANPDVEIHPIQVLGVFLVFAAFALSVCGWGAFLTIRLGLAERGRWGMALPLGTAFASLSAMALGYLGLISYDFSPLAVAWIFAGALLGATSWPAEAFAIKPSWSWLPAAVFWVVFVDWLIRGSLAHGTTDPFIYHLLGPRDWADAGRITFNVRHPATFHANYWESLFIWGNMLLGDRDGQGLIEGQLFAQYAQVGLGVGMCAAVMYRFAANFVAWSGWAWIATLTVLANQALFAYGWLAKNDYGVTGWTLAGVTLLFLELGPGREKRRLELFLAGVFIGMGTIGKIVYVTSMVPMVVVWTGVTLVRGAWTRKSGLALREVLLVAAGGLAGLAPVLLRNFAFTGDPLFPFITTAAHLHHGWLGPTNLEAISQMGGRFAGNLRTIVHWFWALVNATPYLGGASLLLFGLCWPLPRLRRIVPLLAGSLAGILVFSVYRYPESFPRWTAPSLLLTAVLGTVAFAEGVRLLAERLPRAWARAALISVAACLAVFVQRPDRLVDLENIFRVGHISPTFTIRNTKVHQGGDSLAWLRMNAKPSELIVTTGFQMLYYVSNLNATAIVNDPKMDAEVSSMTDLPSAVQALRRHGARYLLDVEKWDARFYWAIGPVFAEAADDHPDALAYAGPDSFILDLEKLSSELDQACELKPYPTFDEA